MTLNEPLTVALAIMTIFLGRMVNGWVGLLRMANIPPAVTGGVVVCLLLTLAHLALGFDVTLGSDVRGILLLVFFASVGLSSRLGMLFQGGWRIVVYCALILFILIVQNLCGVWLANQFEVDPRLGLFAGSIPFSGGHGTVGAWAQQVQVAGVLEVGMACATFGLVFAGLLAAPVSTFLMRFVRTDATPAVEVAVSPTHQAPHIEEQPTDRYLLSGLALMACVGGGHWLAGVTSSLGFTMPAFLGAMLCGVLITSLADIVRKPIDREASDLFGTISLRIFLAISLMSLHLWELGEHAGFITVAVLAQTLITTVIAIVLIFPIIGRTRDGAAMAGATVGFALGSTPVAMSTLKRLESRFGAIPLALLLVTLAVSFFVDYANAFVIQLSLVWLAPVAQPVP